jgi:flagellar hook assembly protein FlgD
MELTIIDPAGRRLRTLFSGMQAAGPHVIRWDGLDESGARLPAGLYLARMATGDARRIARVILVD